VRLVHCAVCGLYTLARFRYYIFVHGVREEFCGACKGWAARLLPLEAAVIHCEIPA